MARKRVTKNYIEHGGRKFHQRANPEAYGLALGLFETLAPGRVFDLAAGAGLTSVRMAEMGHEVSAFEINVDQFVPSEIPVSKVDLNGPLPAEDGALDGVMALEIVEHMESPRAFIREIGRVLRPGGILVLSTPNIVSLRSKLRFLFREEFELFFDVGNLVNDPFCEEATGHISPILPWLLRTFLNEADLYIEETAFTERMGMRNRHFARDVILRAVKRPAAS